MRRAQKQFHGLRFVQSRAHRRNDPPPRWWHRAWRTARQSRIEKRWTKHETGCRKDCHSAKRKQRSNLSAGRFRKARPRPMNPSEWDGTNPIPDTTKWLRQKPKEYACLGLIHGRGGTYGPTTKVATLLKRNQRTTTNPLGS